MSVVAILAAQPVMAVEKGADRYKFAEHVDLAGGVWLTEAEDYFSDLTLRVF